MKKFRNILVLFSLILISCSEDSSKTSRDGYAGRWCAPTITSYIDAKNNTAENISVIDVQEISVINAKDDKLVFHILSHRSKNLDAPEMLQAKICENAELHNNALIMTCINTSWEHPKDIHTFILGKNENQDDALIIRTCASPLYGDKYEYINKDTKYKYGPVICYDTDDINLVYTRCD